MLKKYIFLCLLTLISFATYAEDVDPYQKSIAKVTTAFMKANKVPGVAIQLIVNGEPHSYYFGYANREEQIPVNEKTIFELGSISKIMTGLLLAQEIDFNKMAMTDPVQKHMPSLPDTFKNVTLQQVATHTSGLPFEIPKEVATAEQLTSFLTQWVPDAKSQSEWRYSNIGIGLIGHVLETAYERPYDRIYRSHISWPLGMAPIAMNVPEKLQPDYARGYDQKGQSLPPITVDVISAGKALKMAAIDMQKFLSAAIGLPGTPERIFYPMKLTQSSFLRLADHFEGLGWRIYPFAIHSQASLLAKASQDMAMLQPHPVKEVLEKPLYNGNALIDKTGSTNGFRTYIAVVSNQKSGIAILTNKHMSNNAIVLLGRQILFAVSPVKS